MTNDTQPVKTPLGATSIAPLKNVSACVALVETLRDRAHGLPNFGVLSGYSGYGKTWAAQYCQNAYGAVFLEVREFWTAKILAQKLLSELGAPTKKGTIGTMLDQAIELMSYDPGRPLIVDEADKLVDRRLIEYVRDVAEGTQVPVLLVGEEELPQNLQLYERVHNRVLDWTLAQPCDIEDTRTLAEFTCPKIEIAEDLLEEMRQQAEGKARRIVTTLNHVSAFAQRTGTAIVDLASYDGPFVTGEAPRRNMQRSRRAAGRAA